MSNRIIGNPTATPIKLPIVDQTYNSESENAQSGIAVAEAISQVSVTGPQGPQGEKGADGYTPVRGVDYWTDEDKAEVMAFAEDFANAIKGNASGECIRIDDVSPVSHTVKGKISGDNIDMSKVTVTTHGKNLFYPNKNEVIYNGVTVTVDNDTQEITLNGTLTGVGDILLANYNLGWCIGQKYTLKVHHIDGTATLAEGSGSTYAWSIFSQDKKTYIRSGNLGVETFGDHQFTGTAFESENYYFYLQCWRVGTVFDNFKVKIQIEQGDAATDFEVYKSGATYTPNADGTVEMTSISPVMTITTNTAGANIEAEYNRDTVSAIKHYSGADVDFDNYYTKAEVDDKIQEVDMSKPYIGENGNWFEWDANTKSFADTGVKAHGEDGYTPVKGVDYFDGDKGEDGYTPVRGTDYWTDTDIAEIKAYVDEAILGGEW